MTKNQSKRLLLSLFFTIYCSVLFAQEAVLPTAWTKAAMDVPVPFPEYPRPQLQRGDWMCLNGQWDYQGGNNVQDALAPQKALSFAGVVSKIRVPYCPESVLYGIQRKQEI